MIVLSVICAAAALSAPPDVMPVPFTLATKTPYWSSPVISELYGVPANQLPGSGCTAVQVQHLSRHGSRYGDSAPLEQLQQLLQTKGAAIQAQQYQFLRTWTNPFPTDEDSQLNNVGMDEQYEIGSRHRAEFGNATMARPYNPDVFPFQATYKSRTSRSGVSFALSAFMEGMGPVGPQHNAPIAMYNVFTGNTSNDGDLILRPFSNCPEYTTSVDKNKSSPGTVESGKFWNGNMTSVMVPKVAAKMQLDQSVWALSMDDLELFMNACVFETTVLNVSVNASPCAVFDQTDYEMFAFYDDIQSYYIKGPGIPLSTSLVCPTFNKMLNDLTNPQIQGSYMFTHAETLMPMLSFIGLYTKDVPLTADMPWSVALNRQWNTKIIGTMAVNIDIVLYNCTTGGLLAELRHNERPITWPRCGNSTNAALCSPDDLMAAYPPEFCDKRAEFCGYN